jgi:hypothetical protein
VLFEARADAHRFCAESEDGVYYFHHFGIAELGYLVITYFIIAVSQMGILAA